MNELLQIGFTKNEASVYEELLKNPQSTVTNIAKSCNLDRRTIYDVIDKLFRKGHVSSQKINNTSFFSASDPKVLIEEFHKSQCAFVEKITAIQNSRKNHSDIDVNVFMGKQGIKLVIKEILDWGKMHYAFGSLGETRKYANIEINHFVSELKKRKIPEKILYEKGLKISKASTGEYKSLPSKQLPPISAVLYDDTVVLFIETINLFIIKIKNKKMFDSYLQYFQVLWELAGK